MKHLGKVIAIVAVWTAVGVLSYLFNSFGILVGGGAAWMVIGAFIATFVIWQN